MTDRLSFNHPDSTRGVVQVLQSIPIKCIDFASECNGRILSVAVDPMLQKELKVPKLQLILAQSAVKGSRPRVDY
jgi:hypothetical protein